MEPLLSKCIQNGHHRESFIEISVPVAILAVQNAYVNPNFSKWLLKPYHLMSSYYCLHGLTSNLLPFYSKRTLKETSAKGAWDMEMPTVKK